MVLLSFLVFVDAIDYLICFIFAHKKMPAILRWGGYLGTNAENIRRLIEFSVCIMDKEKNNSNF